MLKGYTFKTALARETHGCEQGGRKGKGAEMVVGSK